MSFRDCHSSAGPILLALLCAILASNPVSVSAQDESLQAMAAFALIEDAITKAVEKADPCIVAIATVRHSHRLIQRQPARNPFNLKPDRIQASNPNADGFKPREFGTGIVVANPKKPGERLILTNYHVVQGGRPFKPNTHSSWDATIHVWFNRHQKTEAHIFAADPRSDLAILKFDMSKLGLAPADIPALPLPRNNRIRKGQFVIALGNPYAIASHDGSPSVSLGMVSNVSRFPFAETKDDKTTIHHFGTLLHVDTRLGPGSSGGALLNRHGELIGITTSLAALEGYESTVGYAIPVDKSTRRIIDDLIRGYEVEYGFLGVRMQDADFRLPPYGQRGASRVGVEVSGVLEASPAEEGGIRAGDVLLSVNARPLYEQSDLFREIGLVAPGETAHIRAYRNGRDVSLRVKVGKWPVDDDGIIVSETRFPAWRGLHVDWPTSRKGGFDQENPYPQAVYIRKVEANTPGAQIEVGQFIVSVNSRRVKTPAEFNAAVQKAGRAAVEIRLADGQELTIRP
ncbi:MAG: trypsin-like peptidase domain-containing protein [Planctomycetes bacterium]|nr:trypsin-like peptidase domain-containing protein [Planctomycetota bacterium]